MAASIREVENEGHVVGTVLHVFCYGLIINNFDSYSKLSVLEDCEVKDFEIS